MSAQILVRQRQVIAPAAVPPTGPAAADVAAEQREAALVAGAPTETAIEIATEIATAPGVDNPVDPARAHRGAQVREAAAVVVAAVQGVGVASRRARVAPLRGLAVINSGGAGDRPTETGVERNGGRHETPLAPRHLHPSPWSRVSSSLDSGPRRSCRTK
jgi:hypothetical protein